MRKRKRIYKGDGLPGAGTRSGRFFFFFICFYFVRRLRLEIEVNMDSQLTTTNLREELSLMCKMSSWPLEAEALEYCLFMAASFFIVHEGRF